MTRPEWDDQFKETEDERNMRLAQKRGIELRQRSPENRAAYFEQKWLEGQGELARLRARVKRLEEEAVKLRAEAMLRRNLVVPEDAAVAQLCERYGYGAVMDSAARLWARKDSFGAFYIGGCVRMKDDAEARAALEASDE